jgi:hypothetical protein
MCCLQYRIYCFSHSTISKILFFLSPKCNTVCCVLLSTICSCCFFLYTIQKFLFFFFPEFSGLFSPVSCIGCIFSFHNTYSVYICCFSSQYLYKYVALLLTMQNAVLIRIVQYGIKYALSNNWLHPLSPLSIQYTYHAALCGQQSHLCSVVSTAGRTVLFLYVVYSLEDGLLMCSPIRVACTDLPPSAIWCMAVEPKYQS